MAMPWPAREKIRAAPNWNSSCPSSARIMLFCPPMKGRILTSYAQKEICFSH